MISNKPNFINQLKDLSRNNRRTIALPESEDIRIIQAAATLLREGLAESIALFAPRSQVERLAAENQITFDPLASNIRWIADEEPDLARKVSENYLRILQSKKRELSPQQIEDWGKSPINQAAYLVGKGSLDAGLAGCVATTAEVIRAALIHIGMAEGQATISGSFAMVRESDNWPAARYMFADCGVVIEPTVDQLVDIAAATATTFRQLFPNDTPRLAFLSFSTKGSAKHPNQEKVAKAYARFRDRYPDILADGELQFDAAFSPEIGRRKAPGSPVAGQANCFIFPNLDAGNTAYKMAQRLAHFDAYGPILQGTKRPFNDLSRGASAQDIEVSALVTMLRG